MAGSTSLSPKLSRLFSWHAAAFALAAVGFSPAAWCQENALSVTSADAIPGDRVSLLVEAQLSQAIRGFQLGVSYPRSGLQLESFSFEGTELEGRRFDSLTPMISTVGFATLRVSLDDRPPFRNDIPAGSAVALVRLNFIMRQGLAPGAEFAVAIEHGLGIPPVPVRLFEGDRQIVPDLLSPGRITIPDENLLKVRSLKDVRPGQVSTLEFTAFNLDPLQGFTIVMKYDPAQVRVLGAHLTGTISEAVGAEFVEPFIDNENGFLILGVLLDMLAPFQNQLIPAGGIALTIAKADIVVLPEVQPGAQIQLSLEDGLGKPPKKNIFVIDNQSVLPRKVDGEIVLFEDTRFLRGDAARDGRLDISDSIRIINYALLQIQGVDCQKAADSNDDGRVDLADVLHILLYLFNRGPILPPPYPTPGFDPTPDALTCDVPVL